MITKLCLKVQTTSSLAVEGEIPEESDTKATSSPLQAVSAPHLHRSTVFRVVIAFFV
jgi:hypothetical protein